MLTKKANKEDLGDVMMKLEGKRPMCLEFCIRAAVSTTNVMNHFKTHQKFFEEKYSALARANCEILWEHMLSVYTELVSTVAEDVKKDGKVHLTLQWMNSINSYLDGSTQNSKVCTPVFTDLSSKH